MEGFGVADLIVDESFPEALRFNIDKKEELEAIKGQAADYLKAYITNDWRESESAGETTYEGAYLLKRKEGVNNGLVNSLIFVFCTEVDNYWEDMDTTGSFYYYWYLKYNDVSVDGEGNYSINLVDYETTGHRAEHLMEMDKKTASWKYYGYNTLEELRTDFVDKNVEKYTSETSIDEEAVIAKDEEAYKVDAEEATEEDETAEEDNN